MNQKQKSQETADCRIAVDDVSHKFSERKVLGHVTFRVSPGEIFGLLGPSGAGKTTLIKILTGQLHRDDGYAEILGTDTNRLGPAQYQKIGAMMDNFGLYERLSVWQNLSFYAEICRAPKERIPDILRDIGLYDARKRPVSKLSKGMRSRLSLGRALLNDAEVLFLDEPTSGLDPVTAGEIHRVLLEQRERGTTIFLTTHNMFEAERLCGRVALLNQGSIIELGTPGEICRKYNHLNQLKITLKNGDIVVLENGSRAAGPLCKYLEENKVAAIHSTEPTLESVFVDLTGKELN